MISQEQTPREYWHGDFTYLLYDYDQTATILKGNIGQESIYHVPDHVMVDGTRYTIVQVETCAYNRSETLEHLVFPDSHTYIPDDCFTDLPNLRSVRFGKNLRFLSRYVFANCPKLKNFHIDKDNPYIKLHNGLILSKDGKKLHDSVVSPKHLIIPEGVEVIAACAWWHRNELETITFPSTLRSIHDYAFSSCRNLRKLVLPEGLEKCGAWTFYGNQNLNLIDFPSTMTGWGSMLFALCPNLEKIILRMPCVPEQVEKVDFDVVPIDTCQLYVPAQLLEQYRQHPAWGTFKNILPIK